MPIILHQPGPRCDTATSWNNLSHLRVVPQKVVVPSSCTDVLQQVEAGVQSGVNGLSENAGVVGMRQVFVDASTRFHRAGQVAGSSVAAFPWSGPQKHTHQSQGEGGFCPNDARFSYPNHPKPSTFTALGWVKV